MEQDEVHAVLGALGTAGIPTWVGGGWGVDALAGRQTRAHRDLDLLVDAERLEDCLSILTARGYAVETDWLPVRVEVGAAGRGWVDIHPVRLAADGSGVQAGLDGTRFDYPPGCFTTGNLAGREVPCLTAAHQQLLHTGYEPRAQDIHDLRVLRTLEPGIDTRRQPPTRDSDRAVIAGADGDLQARFQRIGFAE